MLRAFSSFQRLKHQQEEAGGQAGAQHRAGDRDPAVVPAAVPLARDGQDGVGAARAEVARRVHRVAGGSAQGHTQGHDQAGNRPGADGAGGSGRPADLEGIALEADGQDDEHEEGRGDELGEEVPPGIPDGGHRAEGAEHGVGLVRGGLVVVLVEHIDQQGAHEAAQHLSDDIAKDLAPGELAGDGKAQGDGGIQVCAGDGTGNQHAHHHGKAPRQGNDDPTAAFRLGLVEGTGSAHAVTEEHQDEGADEFENVGVEVHSV